MYYNKVKNPVKLLKQPRLFKEFYIDKTFSIIRSKVTKKKKKNVKIGSRRVVGMEEANRLMYEGLMSDKPFAIARNGGTESVCVIDEIMLKLGAIDIISDEDMESGKNLSGIFPAEQSLFREFANIYAEAITASDLTVYWGHILCEKYILDTYAPKIKLLPSRSLEPFGFEKPWTRALKGKKVLVVHPFEKTILNQYEKREKLFENKDILPEFEIKTVKAVQSLAEQDCGFDSWTEALEHMKAEIEKIDFDIALLGCGAYAIPLMAYCKKLGKKAVVLGGMLQLLFGIKGGRWEKNRPDIVAMYNENWTKADETEKPKGYMKTEDGAYW